MFRDTDFEALPIGHCRDLPLRSSFKAMAQGHTLPPRVTLQGRHDFATEPDTAAASFVELRVLAGNACYRPGESFWLSPARACAAYGVNL